ncbi:Cytochrome bd-I ubiquinol oxidase subunit 2 [Pseudomonas fluorescens]|uniref:cytochrome d ubiquinol oxidase subunit II n=1 Tax=Pseudomonas fluorescens TaxID=294 RepID=UPI00125A4B65|nr:cytochrome d ubiquinol oxidase subunit II [Pseudomonas fluorescens]CAG8865723.1 Cytochrome bd-I ubiquinol oxidase subunit 2 [Pseudomonas fluorescens]VVP87788.1 Cytochrome bd-I ubiquinol oxidase subunit 2 [Pseudomonas fluorescens]
MFGVDWLTLLSAGALAFSVLTYVLLDGTDLGVGMLMGANRRAQDREVMVLSILPIWDANETWLVLGGGGLLALFPLAYATLLPALYVPFLLMFMALILRAVALEFREYLSRKDLADAVLLAGSLLATCCQGLALGTLVQGVPHAEGQYSGSGREWLGPFPLFCALALVAGYLWLGACWLYWRTEGDLQRRSGRQAKALAVVAMTLLAGVLGWSLTLDERYVQHLSHLWIAGPAGLAVVVLLAGFWLGFRSSRHYLPLFSALGVVVVAFAVMLVQIFPLIVPPSLTVTQAASSSSTQVFMLVGFAVIVPVTLAYNTLGFRVFAGKIQPPKR